MLGKKSLLWAARIIVCSVAVTFIIHGINRGEVAVVVKKAISICLECIGLG